MTVKKEKNVIDKIIVWVISVLLTVYPILGGGYRTYGSLLLLGSATFLMILFLINSFIKKEKVKIHLGIVILFLLWILYYIHTLFHAQTETAYKCVPLFMGMVLYSILFYNEMDTKSMNLWKYSILASGILGIVLSTLGILKLDWLPTVRYNDFYISSVNRLYGTFVYPNAFGLSLLVCYFINLEFLLEKKKDIFDFLGYLYLLYFALTISKIGFICFGLFYVIYIFYKGKENIYSIVKHLVAVCIPLFIGIECFRKLYFTSNLVVYVLSILILIILYLLLKKICEKKLILIFVFIITIVTILFPIPKTLTIQNKSGLKYIVLTDFMNLKENHTYKLKIPIKQTGIYRNSKIRITKVTTKDSIATYTPIAILEIKDGKQTITYDLKTEDDFAYYYIQLLHASDYNTYQIDPITLIDTESKQEKSYPLDYYVVPYTYIFQKEQVKYDKGSVLGRTSIYKDCLKIMKGNEWLGSGYGTYEKAFFKYHLKGQTIEEHSYLFKLLLEVGIIGLLIYSLLIIDISVLSLRLLSSKKAITIVLLCMILFVSSCIDFTFSYSQLFLTFVLFVSYLHATYDWQKKDRVLFISSAGGHLTELLHMQSLFKKYKSVLVTEKNHISKNLQVPIKVEYVKYSSRHYLVRYLLISPLNALKSIYLFIKYNPDVIYTTGAHTSVFMCYLGFIFGRKIIFVEVYDRITPTLSGKLVYPIATKFIVQRKELCTHYKKAIYMKGIYE